MEHELIIMDASGDDRVTFKVDDKAAIDIAMARFAEVVATTGAIAYKQLPDGSKALTRTLDPTSPKTILHPQLIGG